MRVPQRALTASIVASLLCAASCESTAGRASDLEKKDVRDLIAAKVDWTLDTEALIGNLKDATGRAYWEADGGGGIEEADSGYLLVTANPQMQRAVDQVLADLRRFMNER